MYKTTATEEYSPSVISCSGKKTNKFWFCQPTSFDLLVVIIVVMKKQKRKKMIDAGFIERAFTNIFIQQK